MNILKQLLIYLFLVFVFFNLSACRSTLQLAPYPEETRPFITDLGNDNLEQARKNADIFVNRTSKSNREKQNKYLVLLERGKVSLAAGFYDQCIADLQAAEKRFLLIEGTISLEEQLGSILTDDTSQEYEAEIHEKIMISPYLALAYLSKGDLPGALVERNRTINKIHQYIEEQPIKRHYLENPFARFICAITYEMEDKTDDAKIEYRKMMWREEAARLNKKKNKTTDLVILIDTGLAPHKYQIKWGPVPIIVEKKAVYLGFAYAAYQPTESRVTRSEVSLDDRFVGSANLLYDMEKTVLAQYDKNKQIIIVKIASRLTAKVALQVAAQASANKLAETDPLAGFLLMAVINVASGVWIGIEEADLRSWRTLPRQIRYLRINDLPPGEHVVRIDYGCGIQEKKINLEKDKIGIAYFSYAR